MKRLLSFVLTLAMLLTSIPVFPLQARAEVAEEIAEEITEEIPEEIIEEVAEEILEETTAEPPQEEVAETTLDATEDPAVQNTIPVENPTEDSETLEGTVPAEEKIAVDVVGETAEIIASKAASLPESIYLEQVGKTTCTLSSAAMMLRSRTYLSGNDSWSSITESSVRPVGWLDGSGLYYNFKYSFGSSWIKVSHASTTGISVSNLKDLLNKHPEGIVLYCGKLPHAVFLTDYSGDVFYCADPLSGYSGKRIRLDSSYLGKKYGQQSTILNNVTAYWYISSFNISASVPQTNIPVGCLDSVTPSTQKVTVRGWAFDKDDVNRSVGIHVYIGNTCIGTGVANQARGDVGTAYPGVGNYHGYEFECAVPADKTGNQEVTVYAIDNEGRGNPILGKVTVNIPAFADLGTDFTAPILNLAAWKPIANSYTEGDKPPVRIQVENGKAEQLWYFSRQSDGSYIISSCHDGKKLDVRDAGTGTGVVIQTCEASGSDAQKWYLYERNGGYIIKSKLSGYVLDLVNDDATSGNTLQTWEQNDTGAQIWAIYRGDECKLTGPTLSVSARNSASKTTFTWSDVYGESNYCVKIWKNKAWEGNSYHEATCTSRNYSVQLPAGTYQAYVDAVNYYKYEMSNLVTFTVKDAEYTISYHANGGSGAPSSQTKIHGETLTLSSAKPSRTGYTFQGWSTSYTATTATYAPGASFTRDADTTLYAVWKANPLNISASASSMSLVLGGTESQTITVTKSGTYTGNNGRCTFSVVADDSNIVSFSWGNINGQSAPLTITGKNAGSTTVTISLIDYDTKEYLKSCTVSVTVTASSYSVSYNANGGSGTPASQTKYHGTNLTLTSSKPTGKAYTVTFNGNGGTLVSNSKTVTKEFTGWNTKSDGTGTSYASGGSYTANTSATLYAQWGDAIFGGGQAPSRDGYLFDGWYASTSVSSDGRPTGQRYLWNTPITKDVTLYAMWVKNDSLLYGDYDRNGVVEFADITSLNRYVLGKIAPTYNMQEFLLRADLDRDGEVTSDDIDIANDLRLGSIGQSDLARDYALSSVSNKPQTTYQYGEEVNTDGLEIVLYFDGGTAYYISEGLSVTGYDPYTLGKQSLTVHFYQFTATYDVNVIQKEYTISYNANGGDGAPAVQTKKHGSTLKLSKTIPTRFGYNFKGWSTSKSDTNVRYQPGDSYATESNLALYAVWEALSITNDFATTSRTATINYPGVGIYYKLIPAMTRANRIYGVAQDDSIIRLYDANGRLLASDDDSGEGTQFQLDYNYTAGETYYLYVKFYSSSKVGSLKFKLAGSYRIAYIDNYGVGKPEDQRKFDGVDTTLSAVTPTRAGYIFKGWAVNSSENAVAYQAGDLYTEDCGINLFAVWEKEVCDHIYSDWKQIKAPTCTEKGTDHRECIKCEYEETRNPKEYGHTPITITGKAATCTATGMTDGKECFVCGTVLIEQEPIAAKRHTEAIILSKAATCTKTGLTEGKKCSGCGEILVEQEIIPATGVHIYENGNCIGCGKAETTLPENEEPTVTVDAPVIKASGVITTGKIKISWSKVTNVAKYEIYRATSKSGKYSSIGTATGTSYTDTKAAAGKMYYYKVKALDAKGKASDFSNIVGRTCDLAQPVVKAVNISSSGKIKLSWDAVDGVVKYEIHRSTSKDGTYNKLATTESTSYTDKKASAGKMYYYKVMAVHSNISANSAFSSVVSCRCKLARPEVKSANISSSGKIKLSWSAVDGAIKYEIHRATRKDGTYSKLATTEKTSFTDKKASVGRTYYYKVKAVHSNTSANSAFSDVDSCRCKLARPEVEAANVASSGKIKLSWSAVSGAVEYEIHRAASKDDTYSKIATTESTSYTDKKASAGKTYKYKVVAVYSKSGANSAFSSVVSGTAKLARPDVTVKLNKNGAPKLSWDKISGATKYYVYRATSKDGEFKKIATVEKDKSSYTDTKAKAGKTYYYKVKAIKSDANSAYSSVDKIKAK